MTNEKPIHILNYHWKASIKVIFIDAIKSFKIVEYENKS